MSLRFPALFAAVAVCSLALGLGTASAQSGKITLYTSQPDADAAKTVEAFKKAYPNVEVDIFRSGTVEVMSKLAAEFAGGQPGADVLLIADAVSMEALKRDDRLMKYDAAKVDGLRAGSFDKDKTYFGSKLITTGIAYNTAAAKKPTSWTDLADPALKGQIVAPSPLYSGAAAIMLSAFAARPDLGWKFFDGLKTNDAVTVRGNGAVLKSVAGGEKAYGVLVDFMALNAKAKGSPVEFVFPKEGAPAVTEPVAILKATKNPEAAKAFIDFILSDDGQKLAVSQGYIPAKEGIPNPSWLPEGTEIKLMPIDIQAVLSTTEADKKRFADMFGG
ncbi:MULTISPECIES: ABC transporter substrate-binding protein [unclassified Chelatococcus]|uniref:ABC transporter substrate-binding protein n=2 Tax=Chelatococcus TaxID=28209 RepID=UPI001BD10CD2|nr:MULTISPECIES: ABC transporter substrate-binding protein [unclassified Chelatococcus]CAH1649853.1 Iron(III) transport system substrate-binding protein [Hyphomicrobiales bacterium]MBS7739657.1 ABC transporter substrate-binding protein [Chelatococcus sp. HY11]MBX3544026.1 ABC transporter substrate-binding protein [Chelatococcus sp.]MCO5075806.1 ABC transporter substrate-binding protein [Chelatococcus sp.]CAH1666886.1 Iron(III) transport system substrate-binding protein [Hyphomicrobiales bacter